MAYAICGCTHRPRRCTLYEGLHRGRKASLFRQFARNRNDRTRLARLRYEGFLRPFTRMQGEAATVMDAVGLVEIKALDLLRPND